jgi:hypothetical protein
LSLAVEFVGLNLQLVHLEFEAFAAGRHVRDSSAYLLQQLELLLIAVVEHFARIFGTVEGLVGL